VQTKLHSLYESISNILLGYVLAMVGQNLIFPLYDIDVSIGQQFQIAALFTLISLARMYFLRRAYNRWTEKLWKKMNSNRSEK